jgi:hypothetical protein
MGACCGGGPEYDDLDSGGGATTSPGAIVPSGGEYQSGAVHLHTTPPADVPRSDHGTEHKSDGLTSASSFGRHTYNHAPEDVGIFPAGSPPPIRPPKDRYDSQRKSRHELRAR